MFLISSILAAATASARFVGGIIGFDTDDDLRGVAKLDAQKLSSFSGRMSNWSGWRARTECAIEAAGLASFSTLAADGHRQLPPGHFTLMLYRKNIL